MPQRLVQDGSRRRHGLDAEQRRLGRLRRGDRSLGASYRLSKSCIAISANTPPVIEIGANRAVAATSALDSMIWSILLASCCTEAAKTSRPIWHHRIAPMHIAHGSPEVYSVAPFKERLPCAARQRRIATISPCAVGSSWLRPKLRPRARTRPSRTITAPNGKSARRASSIAMRIKRSSSAVAGSAEQSGEAAAMPAIPIEAAMIDRRLTGMWAPSEQIARGFTAAISSAMPESGRQFPAEPVADRAAHHQFEVAPLQPRHLFCEHRHALLPRARHAGDVGAPEAAFRPEGLDNLLRVFVDVAIGIWLARIAGRSGALDRDIGVFGERQQRRLIAVRGIVLAITNTRVMVEDQLKPGMALGDLTNQRQVVRRHQRDRNARFLRRRPQPVHRAVGHPILLVRLRKGVAQSEHAGPLFPAVDQRAVLRLVEREIAENGEPVRVFGRGFFGNLARVRVPARRMQDAGVDPGGIHVADAFLGTVGIDLAMGGIAWRSGRPDVNLCIDDQHAQRSIPSAPAGTS